MESGIIIAIISALVASLGTWQGVRVQAQVQATARYTAERTADQADIKELRKENRELRVEVNRLTDDLVTTKLSVVELKAIVENVAKWTLLNCPYDGERCLAPRIFKEAVNTTKPHGANGSATG